ncbi:MAG: RNA polymerase sigma-70 factor [Bacteroidales bacterium]|nr:RNA polymerase sigma-70 factor [Bacteroidales bacterium]
MIRDEKAIIENIKNGNKDVFITVYRAYYKSLCSFASKYFEDSNDAEDIVQDSLIWIWENRNKLEITSLKTYLFSSVKNACLNKLKHLKVVNKHKETTAIELKLLELECDDTYSFDEVENIDQTIEDLLNTLPEQRKKIMKLRYIQGMTSKEIAAQENISQRTVETHLYKAIKSLSAFVQRSSIIFFILLIKNIINEYVNL